MEPRLKAKKLIVKYTKLEIEIGGQFDGYLTMNINDAKRCAMILVDEIDLIYQKLTPKDNPYHFILELEYWQDVKQELSNL